MNVMHEIEPKMKLTSIEWGMLTATAGTLALAVAGKVGVMFGIFNVFYASLSELMIYAALAIGGICLLKIKDRLIAVANKLQRVLCNLWAGLCKCISILWARALPIAIGFLVIAILGRVGVACDGFIISFVFETACGVSNISFALLFDGMIYASFVIVISLLCKNKINEDFAQLIIAIAGIIMLVTFVGVMLSDSISGVLQEGFGVKQITEANANANPNPKNAVLEFIGLGIGGIIAVYGLIAFNKRAIAQIKQNDLQIKQNDLTKIGLSQERFKAAVEHLSNTKSGSGRIASFYEFYYLAKDARGNEDGYTQTSAQTILDILCAHLRLIADIEEDITANNKNLDSPSITDDKNIKDDKNPKRPKEEINSLIGVLFSREAEDIFGGLNYDLQRVNLTKVDFRKIHNPKANVDFSDAILSEAFFDNMNLSGFNFQKATLHKTRFGGANLQKADLFEADLHGALLLGAKLSGAKLPGVNLSGANLPNMKLSEANLSGADLSKAKLPGAKLLGANLSDAKLSGADLSKANLFIANLSDAKLSGADLSGANLLKANLSDAKLLGAKLPEANLSEANLLGADLLKANLSNANLSGADLRWTNLSDADLRWTNLSDADLSGADLFEADLSGANLFGADLSGADFHKANLSDADLFVANLSEVNLSEANLSGADLSGADLSGANLLGADLSGTNLLGADFHKAKYLELAILSKAKYNDRTVFPDGFSRLEDMIEVKKQDRGLSDDDSR